MNIYSESRVPLREYMELPSKERKRHLDLSKPCVEMGADSRCCRALLGMFLETTCEGLGMGIGLLCHACGNAKCNNPEHLYWGTSSENCLDKFEHNPGLGKDIFDKKIQKYGEDFPKRVCQFRKKVPHPNKLSQDEVQRRLQLISDINLNVYGWVGKVSKRLNISNASATKFIQNYFKGPFYKRNSPSP